MDVSQNCGEKTRPWVTVFVCVRELWSAPFCELSVTVLSKGPEWKRTETWLHFDENEGPCQAPKARRDCLTVCVCMCTRLFGYIYTSSLSDKQQQGLTYTVNSYGQTSVLSLLAVFSLLEGFGADLDGIWSTVHLNKAAFMWTHSLWFWPLTTSAVRLRWSVCVFGMRCGISDLISLCSPA